MTSPFPGMNPYLEHPDFWSDFHNRAIVALANVLTPQLLPEYRVTTDPRIYEVTGLNLQAIGRPDLLVQQRRTLPIFPPSSATATVLPSQPVKVNLPISEEVRETFLEVKDAATKEVVTVVEILSPANKAYDGRRKYEKKRQQILASQTALVEMDLLRAGDPLPTSGNSLQSHYRLLVSHPSERPIADLYPFDLPARIPSFILPLPDPERKTAVDFQEILSEVYDRAGLDYFIDYQSDPLPPLSDGDRAWINECLIEKGLR